MPSVEEKKAQVVAMKVLAEAAQEEYQRQQADLEAEGNQISGSLSTLQGMLNSLGLGSIESSSGWIRPASGRISAGTWYYGGGLNVNGRGASGHGHRQQHRYADLCRRQRRHSGGCGRLFQ